jgi:poly-gamma-glutamate synthesis protein (capsule biosynthesis protein)
MITNKILIKAVGDIAPGDYIASGLGVLNITNRYGCDFLFDNVNEHLSGGDLLVGNLEGPLSYVCREQNLRMCGLPEMALSLKRSGFDVLSVANNHVLDHGPEIFKETVSHCQKAGLMICGLRSDSEYYSKPVIINKHGLKIGILAYNWVGSENTDLAGNYIAQVYDGIVNYSWLRDRDKDTAARKSIETKNKHVLDDITELRKHVDIVIVLPHWGYEWIIYPPIGVILEARSFIDAGADLILGSHPHVNQGIEIYKNRIVAYSMGNFLFDSFSKRYGSGMLISCSLSEGKVPEYEISVLDRDNFFRPGLAGAEIADMHMRLVRKSSVAISDPRAENILEDDLIYREHEKAYNRLKYDKVLFLLKTAARHPSTMRILGHKIINFLKIVILRIQGKKVRW